MMDRQSNMIKTEYHHWITELAIDWCRTCSRKNYKKLIKYLDGVRFVALMQEDENRIEDAKELMLRFEDDQHPGMVCANTDEPSVLDVMVALACRCEDHIMNDPDLGDRACLWFYAMIKSLGLEEDDDINYDQYYVESVIDNFISRNYDADGHGGLFTVPLEGIDLRKMEIWNQMNWWVRQVRA